MGNFQQRERCCCFTGHRPEKLIQTEKTVRSELESKIYEAIAAGLTTFISGMARGVDLWAAEIVLQLKRNGEPVNLVCAVPYEGFEARWPIPLKKKYAAILQAADDVVYVCKGYNRFCFQLRNEWMVDHSSRVIAVYNGEPGGTKNTIDYALRNKIPVCFIQ